MCVETSDAPSVLVIGLDPFRVPGPWDPAPLVDAIEAGLAKFAEHGVDVETCLLPLDGSDVDAAVANALRVRPWACVTIGGGLRFQVDLLERVVNLVRRHAPGAAIAFSERPDMTYEAAARWIE